MHLSSVNNMRLFVEKYLSPFTEQPLRILDIGSFDVNGSYAGLFDRPKWIYIGADLELGPNVSVVLKDIYQWDEFKNGEFDVVISGQTFEHVEFIWKTINEIKRVLKPGGLCCIIVPSSGPEHKYPLDCWRIYPDGMKALAAYAGLEVISVNTQWEDGDFEDDSNQWHDTVLIAGRPAIIKEKTELRNTLSNEHLPLPEFCYQFVPRRFLNGSWSGHLPFAHWLIKEFKPGVIVELGTYKGESYFSFCQSVQENSLPTICYAVDTWKGDEHTRFYNEQIFNEVNDYNNRNYSQFSYLLRMDFNDAVMQFNDETVDLLHIDGYHTLEAVRHDFDTWLPKVKPGGIILFHDTAARFGDFGVWRLWEEIEGLSEETFYFAHSWGLGVWLKPGGRTIKSKALKLLFDKDKKISDSQIRNTFVLSATNLSLKFSLSTETEKLNNEIERYKTLKSKYDQLMLDYHTISYSYTWRIAKKAKLIFTKIPGHKFLFRFIAKVFETARGWVDT